MSDYYLTHAPQCPGCRIKLGGATGDRAPEHGDFTVCKYCGLLLSFNFEGPKPILEKVSMEELKKIKQEEPELYADITHMLAFVERSNRTI